MRKVALLPCIASDDGIRRGWTDLSHVRVCHVDTTATRISNGSTDVVKCLRVVTRIGCGSGARKPIDPTLCGTVSNADREDSVQPWTEPAA